MRAKPRRRQISSVGENPASDSRYATPQPSNGDAHLPNAANGTTLRAHAQAWTTDPTYWLVPAKLWKSSASDGRGVILATDYPFTPTANAGRKCSSGRGMAALVPDGFRTLF